MQARISRSGEYFRVYYYAGRKKRGTYIPIRGDEKKALAEAERERKRLQKTLDEQGSWAALSAAERKDLAAARMILSRSGATLTEAAEAFDRGLATGEIERSITWAEAVERFLHWKKHTAVNTWKWYRTKLERTLPTFGAVSLARMRAQPVVDWIDGMGNSATTAQGYLRAIKTVYRFAMRSDQRLVWANPFEFAQELLPRPRKQVIPILTPEQGRLLLWSLPDHWKAPYALRYFTGLRISTLAQTDWSQIDRENRLITVHPFADKRREERFITRTPPRLWDWLAAYAPAAGPVVRSVYGFNSARLHARRRLEAIGRAYPWPRNALRRSFASYGIHLLGLTDTLLTMCHTEDGQTFWKKYFHRSRPEAARAYFSVTPASLKSDLGL